MNQPTTPKPMSMTAVWEDAAAMLRANAGLLSAIAGFFLLLPATFIARYAPPPPRTDRVEDYTAALSDYFLTSWHVQLIAAVVSAIGVIAMYLLLLGPQRPTVATALRDALALVPGFFAVSVVVVFAAGLGFLVLILPGLYLLARLIMASPVVLVEMPNAPFRAVQRAWALSRGRSWSILLMLASVYFVATVLAVAVQQGLGSLLLVTAGPGGLVRMVLAVLQGLVSAAFGTVLTALIAAIYRASR